MGVIVKFSYVFFWGYVLKNLFFIGNEWVGVVVVYIEKIYFINVVWLWV